MDDQTRDLMFSSENPNYETPDDLFQFYKKKRNITLDVCATLNNAKVKENFISPEQNCLILPWGQRTDEDTGFGWMNPPYNKPEKVCVVKCKKKKCKKRGYCISAEIPGQIDFVAKAATEAWIGNRSTVCLLPARTDTEIFHDYIWNKQTNKPYDGVELEFLEGRLIFEGEKDPAPFPSMIVTFFTPLAWYKRNQ